MKYSKYKFNFPIIRFLVYLAIVTMTVSGVSLSRYVSSYDVSDEGRVAQFDVTVTPSPAFNGLYGPNTDYIACYISSNTGITNRAYTFTITNNSEVTVRARLLVEQNPYPAGNHTVTPGAGASDWVTLAPKGGSRNVTLSVDRPALLNESSKLMNDVKIIVDYEQVN